jgi:hypothetical protein
MVEIGVEKGFVRVTVVVDVHQLFDFVRIRRVQPQEKLNLSASRLTYDGRVLWVICFASLSLPEEGIRTSRRRISKLEFT